jgi:hypothetical protein
MTREEKCLLAIERGFTYNPETGKIYGVRGKEITTKRQDGYIAISIRIKKNIIQLLAHHFAWYYVFNIVNIKKEIDHINGIRDDNRIENLRLVTRQENHFNRHFYSGEKIKGYINVKGFKKEYRANIGVNGNTIYLGSFHTEQEAREAYLKAKEKYHVI